MQTISIKEFKHKSVLTITGDNRKLIRKIDLIPGNKYIVNPLNPNKLKNRDRKVILVKIENDKREIYGKVKYLDTSRPGKIEISDLNTIV
jgi:predicted RNA-binding protein